MALGLLSRPRQGWVALPNADPMLVSAARVGVVLTCVTQAARLGLWVPRSDRHHVAAPAHSGAVGRTAAHVHWAKPIVPRRPGELVDPIQNVLMLVACCLPREQAVAVWESALKARLIEAQEMAGYPLPARARDVCALARPFADAGTESIVCHRLRWLDEPVIPQVVIAGRPVDVLIGERLVVQIDGGHHVGPQRDSDIEHDARLRLMGYHVIRVSYDQIMNQWERVHDLVLRAIAQGLHRAPSARRRA
ncbi:endonuclease domain-containing protein [Microbacterium album]|uniref:DUF559 domain-containing protein n=1 Tax=Microbacterium album TaxID=2053191 RepID=A0A917IEZ6_9MICO|nr:DUF559 domain-containing protein [Microbacterium album]GGH38885.1 hypothetical protein GCM10010921_09770 [Microbacterium album]